MIVFISGKITGDQTYRSKFADAETVIANLGHTALNPTIIPDGVEYETCMRICFALIDAADTVVLLPDWCKSDGAQRERDYAFERKKPVRSYNSFVKAELEKTRKDRK